MTLKNSLWMPAMAFLLSIVVDAQGEAVSTKPPDAYAEKIAPLLTPAEKIIACLPQPPAEADEGWVLLDEDVHYVLPGGRRLMVRHRVLKALTDAGAESMGRTERQFRRSTQKTHLVLARTILPDGRVQNVKPEATFLQTPQRDADDALYDDSSELVIIFPSVKVGSITEWIVVTEEKTPRIPGQFTTFVGFNLGWPVHLMRCMVEMPDDLAARLKSTVVGRGTPDPRRETIDEGRTRLTWEAQSLPASHEEPIRAPFLQTGPLIRLTTLKDWGEFLQWYVPLANRQISPGTKLTAEVEALTAKAVSPREILDVLTARVANDVRYVGMEFGSSDLEPHAVAEVWDHQYGDCKDKASLLRAMLACKGITSHLALINSTHLGHVEKRSPDFRDFNHVIVVADLPEGQVFCDPTISGAPAGTISPSDSDRDVLLVKEPEQWLHTPPQDPGRFALNFVSKVAPTGEISGWMTLEAEGYLGVRYADLEARSTKQQLKERLEKRVEHCFPGARLVDVKSMPRSSTGPYKIQAYYVVQPAGALLLPFPLDADYLPDVGSGEERETDVFLWRDHLATTSTFTIPDGFRAASLPPPHSFKSPFVDGEARWEQTDSGLKCSFNYQGKASRIAAADCRSFAQSLAAIRAWLAKPVTLEAGKSATLTPSGNDELGEFPLMPSGEGQLALVNERFPSDGNLNLRRQALEKTLALFPRDNRVQFNAQVQLAYLDTLEGSHDAALQRLRAPLETLRGSVDLQDAALGDYILGLVLKNKGSATEALAVFDKLVSAKNVAPFRRAWAQTQRVSLLEKTDPDKAISAAEDGIKLEVGVEPILYRQLVMLRLDRHEGSKLKAHLNTWLDKQPSGAADVMIKLAGLVQELSTEKPAQAAELLGILTQRGDPAAYGNEFASALSRSRMRVDSGDAFLKVQARLKDWVAAHPEALPKWQPPDSLKKPEDFVKAIDQALKEDKEGDKADQIVRLGVELLIRFKPDEGFGARIWSAASYSDYQDRTDEVQEPPALLFALLDLCDQLPKESDSCVDGRFLRARILTRMNKLDEAGNVLRSLLEDAELPKGFRGSAITRYGTNCLERKDYAAALKTWKQLDHELDAANVPSVILSAVFVALETDRREDTLWFLAQLRKLTEESINKSADAAHLRSFLKFAKDDRTAQAWWDISSKWWPAWLEFERKQDKPLPGGEIVVPIIPSLRDLGAKFGNAARGGRRTEAFAVLRELAHAARWQPEFAGELAALSQSFPQLGMGQALPDFRRFIIDMDGAAAEVPELRLLHLWSGVSLIDGGQPERVPDLVRKFLAKEGAQDLITAAMVRLWALSAVDSGKDLGDVAGLLERLLENPPPGDQRFTTVNSLATIYRKQGRRDDEKHLLEKELLNKDTLKGTQAVEEFKQRLEVLREGGDPGDGPALAAKTWLERKKPAWLEFARPKDLHDAKASKPDEAMRPGSGLLPAEAVKLCILVALDASQPDERRIGAITNLGWHTCDVAANAPEAIAWMEAITQEKSLSRKVRAMALDAFVRNAFLRDEREFLVRFVEDPLLDTFTAEEMPYRKTLRRYAETGPGDLDAARNLGTELLAGALDYFSIESLQRMIHRLAFGGRLEDARHLYEGLGKANYSERFAREKSASQLTALKGINLAKKYNPLQDALRDLYWQYRPRPTGPPTRVIPWSTGLQLNLPQSEATVVRESWISEGTWPREQIDFWFELTRDLPAAPETEDLSLALLQLALEKSPDDDTRAGLIVDCAGYVDIDSSKVRTRLEAVLNPYRNLPDSSLTQEALRAHDLRVSLRTGVAGDSFASLNLIHDDRILQRSRWRVFRSYLASRDKPALKRIVETISAEELLSPMNASLAVQAYRLLGMSDEAELAAERAREAVYDLMLASWMQRGTPPPAMAVRMASELGEPALVPTEYDQSMGESIHHERERLFFSAAVCKLRGRWEECAAHAAEGRKQYPAFYDFYGFEGLALGHLGRNAEAIAALKIFLTYVHNDPEAAEARELLERLEK
jgi:tetratricopeptide (TPR) repeat protein/transglutaminase-like putative cysteine protease